MANWRIGFILASGLLAFGALADEPPSNLIRRVIARETETQKAQSDYSYRQTVSVEEFDRRGAKAGEYREVRDVVFLPSHERSEEFSGKPSNTLSHLKLTEEDFRDIREVQPFLLTADQAFLYETRYRGEERIEGVDCWVLQIRPKQILQGQRLFDGLLWIDQKDASILRSEGEAVPQILNTKSENLFPRFITLRAKTSDGFWFPVKTVGDDTLQFRTGPQRMRLTILYGNYKRFGTDTRITFEK